MAIRLAFNTSITSDLTLEQSAARAKSLGLAGLELRSWHGSQGPACDISTMAPAIVRSILSDAGLQAVSVSTSLWFHGLKQPTEVLRGQTLRAMELAVAIGAPAVRVFAGPVAVGQSVREAVQGIAENVRPVLDQAQSMNIRLLLENSPTLAQSQAWWWLMDLLDHPMARVSWNPSLAQLADANDSSGALAVPTLHRRLGLVKLTNAQDATWGCALIKRLLGVGYDGFLSLDGNLKSDSLDQAVAAIQGWLDGIIQSQQIAVKTSVKKPVAAKPAVTPAAVAST